MCGRELEEVGCKIQRSGLVAAKITIANYEQIVLVSVSRDH